VSRPQDFGAEGPHGTQPRRLASDSLISIADLRKMFRLGRTAAYELTRRPDFPAAVRVSARCYRWWASEVDAFAADLRRERGQRTQRQTAKPQRSDPAAPVRHIAGKVRAARTHKSEES
jgi:predicted DNA-binding transcriptional regulator AlpA